MKLVSAFTAAVIALFGATAQATDIDNGFTQDGSTTYCMGVTTGGSVGTLTFDSLEASNVGRCPVGLTLSLKASEFHVNDEIDVKWSAKANTGISDSIFPNAIDATTKLPGSVTTSALFACTTGTNCATNVGGTRTGADGTIDGAFATDGTKALETNKFTLATAGDYIIVGLVALPGDNSLNLSAEEYIVFKKISVVSADTTISSSSKSTTGSVELSDSNSGSHSNSTWESSTTAPPVTTAPPLTPAPSSSTGSSSEGSHAHNTTTSAQDSKSGNESGSAAEHGSKFEAGTVNSSVQSDSDSKTTTTTTAPTTSGDTTDQTNQNDTGSSNAAKSASTSSSSDGFLGGNGVYIIAAAVGCCIVGVVGFAFVMRRRKEQRMNANKAFDLHSPSLASDMDDSALNGHDGGKIDLTYVANISARNNNTSAENMMSEESSVAIMASAERGSELNSSNGSSMHSLPKSSLDTDEYSDKVSYGASGVTAATAAAAHTNEAEIDAYRMSNMSDVSSLASGTRSEASMSNFGDSVVSARQNKYLQPGDWNDSESSRMDSRLDSMEQAELKARGFGSIGGFSTVSGLSDDNSHDIGFSMSSRPTVESRFTEDYRATEDSQPRFTEDYRATEESRVTEDSRATGFSEAMDQSRLQSEVSVDSYGFRASRESADSYSSGMSPYSREGSRISGFSVSSESSSKY